jgi:ankyrin repeat protein
MPAEQAIKDDADLVETIKLGDLPAVSTLLFAGTSPDTPADDGTRPLFWAVRVNRSDIVKLLLEKGADVNAEEDDEGTALELAAMSGHADLVKLLLSRGAAVNHKDHGGHTALMMSAMGAMITEVPHFVLQTIWDSDENDRSEAVLANLGHEHRAVMDLLLEAGADADLQADDCGLTALMIAAMGGKVDLVQTLLKHRVKVNIKNDDGNALKFAETIDSPEGIADLLEGETEQSATAWLSFVRLTAPGRREVAKLLRAAGAQE